MSASAPPFAFLLRLLPASFRARHGRELHALIEQMKADLGPTPRRSAVLRFYAAVTWDLLFQAARAWAIAVGSGLDAGRASLFDAVSGLRRNPGFTLISVGTLALGIGATAAAFSVLDGVLLKPLPYPDEDRLVAVALSAPGIGVPRMSSAPFLHFTYVEQNRTFAHVALWRGQTENVRGRTSTRQASAVVATADLLPALGVEPFMGRVFSAEDDMPGSAATAVVSYGYWQRELNGDPSVVGRQLIVDGRGHSVIGVMPRDFAFLDRSVDLFLPYQFDRSRAWLGGFGFDSLARLRPGVTLEEAQADVARMIPIAIATTPPSEGGSRDEFADRLRLQPNVRLLREDVVGGIARTLWVVMGAVCLVLVIACANTASLILLRSEVRQLELGVRAALGAGRWKLTGDLIMEGAAIGAAAGVVGLVLARAGVPLLVAMAPDGWPRASQVVVDSRVSAFAAIVSVAAGVLLGLISGMRHSRYLKTPALLSGGRMLSSSPRQQRALGGLVVVQVALSLVLLVGSGLMIRTYQAISGVDPGFDFAQDVETTRIAIPEAAVPDAERAWRTQNEFLAHVRAIPGVAAVGLASTVPMDGAPRASEQLRIDGRDYGAGAVPALRRFEFVSPGYFETIGTDFIAGRNMSAWEIETRQPVALVSETLARQEWGTAPAAVGQRIRSATDEPWREVVGVVQDVYDRGPHQPADAVAYFPLIMDSFWEGAFIRRDTALVVRGPAVRTERFQAALRDALWAVDPELALQEVRPLDVLYGRALASHALVLTLLAAAGVISLLLGIVGLYGVVAYATAQRRREIGLRMALGAMPGGVRWLLVRRGLALAATGVVAGVGLAAIASRFLSSLLFQTSPIDLATYAAVSAALIGAAALASLQPALQASRVSPTVAMRRD